MTETGVPVVEREEIVRAVGSIEPMPIATARLLSIVADDGFSVSEIVDVVRHDTALAGDVLSRANSAAYAAKTPIGDIAGAVARLGAGAVVQIAVARAVKGRLSSVLPVYGMAAEELWRHSVIASVVADRLLAAAPDGVPSGVGTAALIHDVGKTVIAAVIPNSFLAALGPAACGEGIDLVDAEARVLGIDHAEVGALVSRCWGMPVSTQVALAQHHRAVETLLALPAAVELSSRLAHIVEEIIGPEAGEAVVSDSHGELLSDHLTSEHVGLLERLGLSESSAQRLLIESTMASHQLLDQFG